MTHKKMQKVMSKIVKEITKTRESGQKEYAHDTDNVFANFERVAHTLDLPREKVLMVYLLKHIDGIVSHIGGHRSQREAVTGRITDAIVYLMLLWGMFEDTEYNTNELIERTKNKGIDVNKAWEEHEKRARKEMYGTD